MSSTGQAIGMVVGAIVGVVFPVVGFALGAAIGGALGALIDPPKGQDVVGPRLDDLTVQSSTYGAVMPRLKGTVAVTGNVFWLEGDALKENKKTKKVGGKGGGSAKQTTYTYSATFAVGLSHQISGPVSGIRRLWLGNKLVYDAGSGNTESTIASLMGLAANLLFGSVFGKDGTGAANEGIAWKLYDGSDDQQPDPRMQADKGVANVSGYPGRCYIVFYDLDLTEHYQNTLMGVQAKVELVNGDPADAGHTVIFETSDLSATYPLVSATVGPMETGYAVARLDYAGKLYGVDYYSARYGEFNRQTGSVDYEISPAYGLTSPSIIYCMHSMDGVLTSIFSQGQYLLNETTFYFVRGSAVTASRAYTDAEIDYGYYSICATDAGETYMANSIAVARPIIKWSGTDLVDTSSHSVRASAIALSENRVFVSNYAAIAGTTTVSVFDRETLDLISDYTSSVNGEQECAIYPISDTEFYLASGASLSHWVDGIGTSVGSVLTDPIGGGFYRQFVVSRDPDIYLDFASSSTYDMAGTMTSYQLTQQPAKLRDIVTEECALVGIDASDLDLTELVDSDVRGYRVSTAGSVRSVLEQLQAAFPFDVIQSGYKVKFKSRGGASVLTILEEDLGASVSGEMPPRFSMQTEMPSQVPAKVTFNFLNPDREYDPDEQSAAFTAQEVKNSYTVSLPLVMTPTEALQAADVLLKKEQIERTTVDALLLPPTEDYLKLEAADVIDVVAQGRTHTIRLIKVTQRQDGVIECAGKLTSSSAYTSTAEAQDSLALGQTTVALAGSSELLLLDMPRIVSDQDVPGLSLAMYGYTTGWPGGVALRSDDFSETFNAIVAFNTKTEVFTVTEVPVSVSSLSLDKTNRLTLTPVWTGADLSSITDLQLYAGGNLALYGASGRWEVIAFKTVVDNTGSFTISDIARGRYGTEWAMTLHAANDQVVMLDLNNQDFAALPISALNSPRWWRGVTSGASLDSDTDEEFTWEGENLRPLSPCYVKGSRHPSAFDWTITAIPRSRWPVEPFSGVATPDSEPPAAYEVDIWASSGYSALKRTISGLSSPSASYTEAQQVTDFGVKQENIYVDFYKVSPLVGRGRKARAALNCILEDDPYAAEVFALLHFDVAGTTITDVISGNTWSVSGNATQSITDPKFGAAALSLDGTDDYIGMTFGAGPIGTGDFTFEWWEKASSTGNRGRFMLRNSAIGGAGNTNGIAAAWNGTQWNTYGGGSSYTLGGSANSTSAYTHMAMERYGTTVRLYVDGTPLATTYTDSSDYSAHVYFYIGVYYSTVVPFQGVMDEFRATAAARYRGSSFTPPTAAFSDPP